MEGYHLDGGCTTYRGKNSGIYERTIYDEKGNQGKMMLKKKRGIIFWKSSGIEIRVNGFSIDDTLVRVKLKYEKMNSF